MQITRNFGVLVAVAGIVLSGESLRAQEVWVCPDMYRIDPVSGDIMELADADADAFKTSNEIWDGKNRVVKLDGARNEVLGFQVVVDGTAAGIDVTFPDLQGPGEFVAKNFEKFLLWNKRADAVLPFYLPNLIPFSVPLADDRMKMIEGQKLQSIWVDVKIPGDTKAGAYQGVVSVTSKGRTVRSFALHLKVRDITLPERPSYFSVLRWDGARYMQPFGAYRKWNSGRQEFNIEINMHRLLYGHGCSVYIRPIDPGTGQPFAGCAPDVVGEGAEVTVKRWDLWDGRYSELLGGTWDLGPLPLFEIPVSPTWPVPFSLYKQDPAAYRAALQSILAQFHDHFAKQGWKIPAYTLSFNMTPKGKIVPWNLRDPARSKAKKATGMYADLVAGLAKKKAKLTMSYALTTERYCGRSRSGVLEGIGAEALKNVGVWILPPKDFQDPDCLARITAARKGGGRFWALHDVPSAKDASTKTLGGYWRLWGTGAEGVVYNDCGALEGLDGDQVAKFLYHGKQLWMTGALMSVRIKHIRRAIYDLEYMKLAARERGQSVESIRREIEPFITSSPEGFHMGRRHLARLIAGDDA